MCPANWTWRRRLIAWTAGSLLMIFTPQVQAQFRPKTIPQIRVPRPTPPHKPSTSVQTTVDWGANWNPRPPRPPQSIFPKPGPVLRPIPLPPAPVIRPTRPHPEVNVPQILNGAAAIIDHSANATVHRPPAIHSNVIRPNVVTSTPIQVRPQPAVTTPAPSVIGPVTRYRSSATAVPTNSLAQRRTSPPSNQKVKGLRQSSSLSLTDTEAAAAVTGLETELLNDADQFDESHSQADRALDRMRDYINGPTSLLTPGQKTAINAALDSGDPRALEAALRDAGAPPPLIDFYVSAQSEVNAKRELLDAIRSGANSTTISQLSNGYLAAQTATINAANSAGVGLPPVVAQAALDESAAQLNDMVATQVGIETIRDLQSPNASGTGGATNIGWLPLPTGPIMVTWLPQMAAGAYVAVDPQTVLIGTGEGGILASGLVTPAEAGLPVVEGEVIPNSTDSVPVQIVLLNPAENGAEVSFWIDNRQLTLASGETIRLATNSSQLKFDRGGGYGQAEHTLRPGLFVFKLTDQGWSVVSRSVRIVLDNRANSYPFRFVLNNEAREIPARDSLELTSTVSCEIRFDDGNGREQRKLLDPDTYAIAINPLTQGLDVFSGEAIPSASDSDAMQALSEQMDQFDAIDLLKSPLHGSGKGRSVRSSPPLVSPKAIQPPPRLRRGHLRETGTPPVRSKS